MTVFPLVVMTSLPLIVSFTGSMKVPLEYGSVGVMEYWSTGFNLAQRSTTPILHYSALLPSITPLLRCYCAALLDDMRFEFIPEFLCERRRRHGRGIAEGTNRVTHNVAADIQNKI